jgi:four helix bundle protein
MEKPHKKLNVWRSAMPLVAEIYQLTEPFPSKETYGLTSQIRKSAISIPSNIAEGAARQTRKEFINFLHVAQGSLSELDTQLEIAVQLGFLKEKNFEILDNQTQQIDKMISGLIRHQKKARSEE